MCNYGPECKHLLVYENFEHLRLRVIRRFRRSARAQFVNNVHAVGEVW